MINQTASPSFTHAGAQPNQRAGDQHIHAEPGAEQKHASASHKSFAAKVKPRQASLNLGVIGNGMVNALVDGHGRIVWHCVPAFDGDPVFCSLLSPTLGDAGFFDVALEDEAHCEQHYERNSAVLVTVLTDAHGAQVEITDFAPRYMHQHRMYHPMQLLRRVRPLAGSPRVALRLRPLTGYGTRVPECAVGSSHLRYVLEPLLLRVTSDAQMPMLHQELPFLLDRPVHILLGPDEVLRDAPAHYFDEAHSATVAYWQEWTRSLSIPSQWQEAVIRAAITLKLCQYDGTGAIVAAMTTSIPEAPDTVRTWDYRYCWPRDAGLCVRALNRLSATGMMEEYIRYTFNLPGETGELDPVYGLHFQNELPEREEKTLAGYRGMGPVRVGNEAWKQRQHDVYGSLVLAATQLFCDRRLLKIGGQDEFQRLERAGEMAWKQHDTPDAGLWELRGRKAVHTYSVVMCWVACDRLALIAGWLGLTDRQQHWRQRADGIRRLVLAHGVHKDGYFVESFGSDEVDASLLLLEGLRFASADDPRFVKTVEMVGRRLMQDGFLRRYAQPDDFGAPKTSFLVCNFWYVEALTAIGRADEGHALFEKMLAIRNPLGLLSEDFDPKQNELWGNFPQTYSMVGLINAARGLAPKWSDVV